MLTWAGSTERGLPTSCPERAHGALTGCADDLAAPDAAGAPRWDTATFDAAAAPVAELSPAAMVAAEASETILVRPTYVTHGPLAVDMPLLVAALEPEPDPWHFTAYGVCATHDCFNLLRDAYVDGGFFVVVPPPLFAELGCEELPCEVAPRSAQGRLVFPEGDEPPYGPDIGGPRAPRWRRSQLHHQRGWT